MSFQERGSRAAEGYSGVPCDQESLSGYADLTMTIVWAAKGKVHESTVF